MAIDLDAIRKRVAELNGQRRQSNIQMWKPGPGEYKIRMLPWKDQPDGSPIVERVFYYFVNPGILAPYQFGKPDPINDLIRSLFKSGKPEDKALVKQFQTRTRAYMPIVVRGEEDKGVLVWPFGKEVNLRLLGFWLDEDVGDPTDPEKGFDLKVTIHKPPGAEFNKTIVDAARKPSKLMDNAEQAKKLLDSVPDLDGMYPLKSAEEIQKILDSWLAGDKRSDDSSNGTEHSSAASSASKVLDDIVNDIKSESKKEEAPKEEKKRAKKSEIDSLDDDDAQPVKAKSKLDAAFDELLSGDAE